MISGIAFVSVYAPATFDPLFFPNLTTALLELSEYKFIIGAHMNAVVNPSIDRSSMQAASSQKQVSASLKKLLFDLGLIDIYRALNLTSEEYTFFSNTHKTYSRICLVSCIESCFPNLYIPIFPG